MIVAQSADEKVRLQRDSMMPPLARRQYAAASISSTVSQPQDSTLRLAKLVGFRQDVSVLERRFRCVALLSTVAIAIALAFSCPIAAGHVSPAVDNNNRYIKVSPHSNGVRLAYTVFIGERPGTAARKSLDADRNERISDQEAMVFGERLATELQAAIEVQIDGAMVPISWTEKSVGLGSDSVTAGAFSIDLVAWICWPGGGASPDNQRHTLAFKDNHQLPKLGETEVKVEHQPGVNITDEKIGTAQSVDGDFRFVGAGGPLKQDGLSLAFVVADPSSAQKGMCAASATGSKVARWQWLLVAAAAVLVVIVGVAITVNRRRRLSA
jgi:hypothetical protein